MGKRGAIFFSKIELASLTRSMLTISERLMVRVSRIDLVTFTSNSYSSIVLFKMVASSLVPSLRVKISALLGRINTARREVVSRFMIGQVSLR